MRKDQGAQIGRPTSTTKCVQGDESKGVYVESGVLDTQRSDKAQCSHKTEEEQISSRIDKYRTKARSKPALIPHDNKQDNYFQKSETQNFIQFQRAPNHEPKTYIYKIEKILLELMLVIDIGPLFMVWIIKTINRLFGKLTTP